MSKRRIETWLAVLVLGLGGLIAGILGLFAYVSATATPLHPDPDGVPSVSRADPSPRWAGAVARARQIVRADLVEQNLPGLSVAVGVGDEIAWAEGVGWADLEARVRVTPETRFRIGTASMVLTSAAVGRLLEMDRLKLDEEIQTYVADFPRKQWPVTLRQLMGHLAGVRNDAGDEEPVTERCERTADGLRRFAESPLRFEPGTQYRFSTYGWFLVSAAVETAAAEPFFAFVRKEIFERLGMEHTSADSGAESIPDRAVYYFPRFAADPRYGPQSPSEVDYSCFGGASAFLSTPSDLVRFGIAINSGKFLQSATVQLLQTSLRLPSGEETGYGLGWDIEEIPLAGERARVVGHDGELRGGRVASFMTSPERGIVVAVTSNTSFANTSAIAAKVAEVFAEPADAPARK